MRTRLFRKLIEHGGSMTTGVIEKEINCSKPTALKEMKTMEILGVCSLNEDTGGDNEISLSEDFKWFLSDECQAIRGISSLTSEINFNEEPEEAIKII
jgi:hypothetical protein